MNIKLTASSLSSRVAARGAGSLLLVEGHLAAASATSVCLGVSFTETLGSLSLLYKKIIKN